jgi:hypothetical protein
MVDIQFEEDIQYQRMTPIKKKSIFVRTVLATGIVSTEDQANYVLASVAIFLFMLAFVIPSFLSGSPRQQMMSRSDLEASFKTPPNVRQ